MTRYYPDFETFADLARQGNVIPVYRRLFGDSLTPVSAYRQIAGGKNSFLLESVVGGEKIARYSFAGADPFLTIRAHGSRVRTESAEGVREFQDSDPVRCLGRLMEKFKAVHQRGLPRFVGGAVGYAGYDVIRYYENLPHPPADDRHLADLHFALYDSMVLFDHVDKTIRVIANAMTDGRTVRAAYDDACRKIDLLVEKLRRPTEHQVEDILVGPRDDLKFESTFSKEDYQRAVLGCQEYIKAGDIFQVVISQRLAVESDASSLDIYRALRIINPRLYVHDPDGWRVEFKTPAVLPPPPPVVPKPRVEED